MTHIGRIRAAALADWRSFARRRTAVFFTFFFPVLLVVIFGVLVRTGTGGGGAGGGAAAGSAAAAGTGAGGLFTEPPGYYVPGYLAVVVLFTPLTRLGSEVARHREGNRFEKLATTPLTGGDWLAAQTLVNVAVIGAASALVLGIVLALTGAEVVLSPLLVPFVAAGVVLFCGVGAILGRIADSQDGAVAAANAIGLPLLFLSETFVPPAMLPAWFEPVMVLSPLTYFSRGVRAATFGGDAGVALASLAVLVVLAVVFFVLGAVAIPESE